jgi:hypothetical protein
MPQRRGKAACASWLSALILAPVAAFGQANPAPTVAPASTLTPQANGPLAGAHNLMVRLAPQPMGDNTAVRLWVFGDSGKENLRVHLYAAPDGISADQAALVAPDWFSDPIPITWTGWRKIVLSRAQFTLRDPGLSLNTELPAGDQPLEDNSAPAPHWDDINAIGIETGVPLRAALGLDDIAWVTPEGDAGAAPDATVVDDFETGDVAAWQSVGTDTQQQALVYGITTKASEVHGGRVAFHLTITSPAAARVPLLASARKLMDRQHLPYLVWTPANRFDPILPSSLPPAIGADPNLTVQVAPGQTWGVGVCLYSAKSLSDVTVTTPSSLQGLGHVLPASIVDVRVVKVLTEPGGGLMRDDDFTTPTPDLLVKDDRVSLSGTAPTVRLTGGPATDVPADSAKEFWVTLTVPNAARPGAYSGRLLISGKGLSAPVPVHLDLTVMPLPLASSPAKQYAINLRSRLDPAPATLPSSDGRELVTDFVDPDTLNAQLADIHAHGFDIATLYDSTDTIWDAEADYLAHGFDTPYNVYMGDGDPRQIQAVLRAHNVSGFEYFVDPNDAGRVARIEDLGKHGMTVATYLTQLSDFTALQTDLDVPVYSVDSDYSQKMLQTDGTRINGGHDWWYWPAAQEAPLTDRLDCGWRLWRANLYGAYVPDYQTAFGTDPYDLDSTGAAAGNAALRSQMLTYPVQGGVLDTLRWESIREGVNDVLYLTTLFESMRQCKDAHIAKPLTDEATAYVTAFLNKSPGALSDAALDDARLKVAHYTLLMNAQLAVYNKVHHITP